MKYKVGQAARLTREFKETMLNYFNAAELAQFPFGKTLRVVKARIIRRVRQYKIEGFDLWVEEGYLEEVSSVDTREEL